MLISPPSWGLMLPMTTPAPPPPLGLVLLKRILEEDGHEVILFDTGVCTIDLLGIQHIFRTFNPNIVGITTYFQNPAIYHIAKMAREIIPEALIALGGCIATKCAHEILAFNENIFDVIIRGEGIEPLRRLAEIGGCKKKLLKLDTFYKYNGGYCSELKSEKSVYSGDLYLGMLSPAIYKQIHYVFNSGCPFKCSFCIHSGILNDMEFNVESIANEIIKINKVYGNELFMLFDETTTYSKKRILRFAELIKRCSNSLHFWCGTRSDCLDEEIIDALYEIGVKRIFVGTESTDPDTQRYVGNKCRDLDKVRHVVACLKSRGIKIETSVLLGLPFEKRETFFRSIQDCKDMGIENIMFNILSILPTTELYRNCESLGYKKFGEASCLKEFFDQSLYQVNGKSFFEHPYIKPEEFPEIIEEALDILDYDNFNGRQISFKKKVTFRLPY